LDSRCERIAKCSLSIPHFSRAINFLRSFNICGSSLVPSLGLFCARSSRLWLVVFAGFLGFTSCVDPFGRKLRIFFCVSSSDPRSVSEN
jgi:hypothetical protein